MTPFFSDRLNLFVYLLYQNHITDGFLYTNDMQVTTDPLHKPTPPPTTVLLLLVCQI